MQDIWSIYRLDDSVGAGLKPTNLINLRDLLFRETIHLSDQASDSFYCIAHSHFYSLLAQPEGLRHLARLVELICTFLQELEQLRLNYGNVRPENIIVVMSQDGQQIQGLKLINFGHT